MSFPRPKCETNLLSSVNNADHTEICVNVFVRTCYEQWGRWRNYHLFRIFGTFKEDTRVKFAVELVLEKMALEVSIDEQLVYSRLMQSGYHSNKNLTDYVVNQINLALTRTPLCYIPVSDYHHFLAKMRRVNSLNWDLQQADNNWGTTRAAREMPSSTGDPIAGDST